MLGGGLGTATLDLADGGLTVNEGLTLDANGILNSLSVLNLNGPSSNAGTLNNQGVLNNQVSLTNQGTASNAGTLDNLGTLDNQSSLINLVGGTLTNAANQTLTNSGTLNNTGSLANSGALGHSGGGALALLLGLRFPSTRAVLTVTGNADIDVWADLHDYSRLQGSSNPADFSDGRFPEIHYLGERDETIPPALFRSVLQKRRNVQIHTIEGCDHVCCWDKLWTDILKFIP